MTDGSIATAVLGLLIAIVALIVGFTVKTIAHNYSAKRASERLNRQNLHD